MTKKRLFIFGEKVDGYDVPVFNEREVRAAAGILFLFAFISFMHAWLVGNYAFLRAFIVFFFLDFFIRLVINSSYSPSLLLGRLFVKKQDVEYAGAPQKRFAWGLGLGLASFMLVWVVVLQMTGIINFLVCLTCLSFLFFEAAFGICVGCKLYNLFSKNTAQYCPGGVCKIKRVEPVQKINHLQSGMILLGIATFIGLNIFSLQYSSQVNASEEDCVVPDWAVSIGHAEKYKLHHGCNNE